MIRCRVKWVYKKVIIYYNRIKLVVRILGFPFHHQKLKKSVLEYNGCVIMRIQKEHQSTYTIVPFTLFLSIQMIVT